MSPVVRAWGGISASVTVKLRGVPCCLDKTIVKVRDVSGEREERFSALKNDREKTSLSENTDKDRGV